MSRILALAAAVWLGWSTAAAQQPADESAKNAATSPAAAGASAPAAAPAAPKISPEGAAARQAFDVVLAKWNGLVKQINDAQKTRKDADEATRKTIDEKIVGLHKEAELTLGQLVDAGLAVYKADPEAFPDINSTLLYIAQYDLTGDPQGDGGDQYERAMPLVKALIDAGATKKWPDLWTWGAVAAVCTNDFPAAEQYFAKARESGALGDAPPSVGGADPRFRLYGLASQLESILPALKKSWEKESALRDAEAKANDLPRVKFTTTKGDIVIELFENEAPESVANFITLVKQGFYNGVPFHRVLPGFMAQGGDPTGTGSGGPGYAIRCECYNPDFRHHFRGSLSMAHAGRDTGGSQFFLTFVPTSFLDGRHTVFGRVVEGMDVAASLRRRDPQAPSGAPDKIVKAEVLRDRGHEYKFEKLPGR